MVGLPPDFGVGLLLGPVEGFALNEGIVLLAPPLGFPLVIAPIALLVAPIVPLPFPLLPSPA